MSEMADSNGSYSVTHGQQQAGQPGAVDVLDVLDGTWQSFILMRSMESSETGHDLRSCNPLVRTAVPRVVCVLCCSASRCERQSPCDYALLQHADVSMTSGLSRRMTVQVEV